MDSLAQTMKEPALKFVKNVKRGFNNPEDEENNKYNQFASVLNDFFQEKISAEVLVAIMESLFEGHPNLLSEFKIFLPKNDQETESITNFCGNGGISVQQACNEFMCKVKDRFKDNLEVYTTFLEIMIQYGTGMLNVSQVYKKTYKLLFGHADLICEFEFFLTDQDEKVRREIEKIWGFIIEDRLHEVDIWLSNLESIIAIIDEKLLYGGLEDDGTSTGLNLGCIKRLYGGCIKRLYGDYFGPYVEKVLRNDPTQEGFRLVLPRLKEKAEELGKIKDSYFNFVKECHRLRSCDDFLLYFSRKQ